VSSTDKSMIGKRIAYFRKRRRLTQQQLAVRTHVSVSLLSKVEAGLRPATPALVAALAPTLGIRIEITWSFEVYSGILFTWRSTGLGSGRQ
jgi:transcriptional regulator with XRE-family HTH domain